MTMTNEATTEAARAAYEKLMFSRKYVAPHAGTGANDEDGRVYHNHHILPKSLFCAFEREPWNLVRLSFREHIEAHELLVDATEGDDRTAMARALVCMTQMHRDADGHFDVKKAEEAACIANEAHSRAQRARLKKYWSRPEYQKQKSTVHDAVALRGDLDSILKILYHKDLRDVRTPSRPSAGNGTSAFRPEQDPA